MEKKILDQVPCFLVDDPECSMLQDGSGHQRRTAQVFLTGSQIGCFRHSPAPDPFIHPPVPIFQRIRQPTNGPQIDEWRYSRCLFSFATSCLIHELVRSVSEETH